MELAGPLPVLDAGALGLETAGALDGVSSQGVVEAGTEETVDGRPPALVVGAPET